jgi:hypothetical protein
MEGKTALRKIAAVALALCVVTMGPIAVNPYVEEDISPVGESEAAVCGGACVAVGAAVAAGTAGYVVGTYLADRDPDVAEKQETIQTKIDLYQTAKQQESVRATTTTVTQNSIRSTDVKMQMEGIQALAYAAEQDLSLTEAKAHVASVLDNRTTTKMWNINNAWSAAALTTDYVENRSDVAPNIKEGFASLDWTQSQSGTYKENVANVKLLQDRDWNRTVTLENGTEQTVTAFPVRISEDHPVTDNPKRNINDEGGDIHWIRPGQPNSFDFSWSIEDRSTDEVTNYDVSVDIDGYEVRRNNSDDADAILSSTENAQLADAQQWTSLYEQANDQNNEITQTIHQIAENKYAAIKRGDIQLPTEQNPYYASEMAASEGMSQDAFLASYYSSLGQANPEDWQDIQSTTVTTEDGRYLTGHLLGDTLGAGEMTFEQNRTYNASDLDGTITVATPNGRETIDSGNFTITEIEGTNGQNVSSLTFEEQSLNASTLDGYREAVQWMQEQQAESEAREKKQEDAARGGGGLPDVPDSVADIDTTVLILALLGLAAAGIAARFVSQ